MTSWNKAILVTSPLQMVYGDWSLVLPCEIPCTQISGQKAHAVVDVQCPESAVFLLPSTYAEMARDRRPCWVYSIPMDAHEPKHIHRGWLTWSIYSRAGRSNVLLFCHFICWNVHISSTWQKNNTPTTQIWKFLSFVTFVSGPILFAFISYFDLLVYSTPVSTFHI
jgi:hypothetical protein